MLQADLVPAEPVPVPVPPSSMALPAEPRRRPRARRAAPARQGPELPVRSRRQLSRLLKEVFGLQALRPGQHEVIARVLAGQSTLAIMPTGAGKSLCYQLPALMLPGCTLVVSPLIALMKDQCEKLRAHGLAAVEFNSSLDAQALAGAEAALADGSARIVLVTPERLADPAFLKLVRGCRVSLMVVDEAHCIAEWGHDFRPAFLEIGPALRALGQPPVLALTATAPPDTAAEICRLLRIGRDGTVDAGTWRANLRHAVVPLTEADDKLQALQQILQDCEEPGIVYCATVRAAEEVHAALLAQGRAVGLYHGKLRAAERHAAQDAFMQGRTRVMVATNAFGMGIDKADLRFVVHYQMPASLDAYYQESGRAGRDGLPARCVLLYQRRDRSVQHFFLGGRSFTETELQRVLAALPSEGGADLVELQQATGLARARIAALLAVLHQARHCRKGRTAEGAVGWLQAAVPRGAPTLAELVQAEQARRQDKQRKLQAMVDYAESGACRWNVLQTALEGEPRAEGCGHCDNCDRMRQLAAPDVLVPAMAGVPCSGAGEAPALAH